MTDNFDKEFTLQNFTFKFEKLSALDVASAVETYFDKSLSSYERKRFMYDFALRHTLFKVEDKWYRCLEDKASGPVYMPLCLEKDVKLVQELGVKFSQDILFEPFQPSSK